MQKNRNPESVKEIKMQSCRKEGMDMRKGRKTWKKAAAGIGCAAALLIAGCSGQKPLSDRFEEETVKKTAEEIIALVHEGDYETIIEEYESAKLVTVLTEEDLSSAVQPVMEELGKPGEIEKTAVNGSENPETKEAYATAVSVVSYENGKAQYTITFNQSMKMEGFYIK